MVIHWHIILGKSVQENYFRERNPGTNVGLPGPRNQVISLSGPRNQVISPPGPRNQVIS